MKRISAPLVALLLGALILWKLASWSGQVAQRDQDAIQGAQAALEASRPFHRQIERLQAVAAQHGAVGVRLVTKVVRDTVRLLPLLLEVDSLRHAYPILDEVLTDLTAQRDTALAAAAEFRTAWAAERQRAELAEARVALLETNLKAVVRVADCHVGGIGWLPRCPSRTTSLVLGAGLGATAVILAR